MRFVWVILLLLSGYGLRLQAQDLTGQWTGTAIGKISQKKQKLVLSITESDSSIGGVLHWYSPETQIIRHIIVSGRFYGKDSILTIREDSTMNLEEGRAGGPPGGFYILFYRRTAGRRDQLEGHWQAVGGWVGSTEELMIRLEKKAPPFIPMPVVKPPHKKKDSADNKPLQALLGRENVVAKTIPVQGTDTIRVALYDNGEIDGDSVSLFMNNVLLLQHLKLTAEPKVLLIPIDKSLPVNRLLLFAENLGRLPPNTALMEVTVHGKTYELFLSTDFRKNASVEFNLQE
ncbi:hypothetical protein [Puia dinghuensis]|uniref:Uncharacterized protein n=1 Tax=Puia dinghuensis TaxID=1792502 RepID=A0A8J2UEI2_9BACT|nr:hypothetical protein [Puia dinghuensis]GGB05723.1 hypothetical protein GCM10011511_31370 [Puia dinghuensis]